MNSFKISKQPDDITCGPTCLHAVYSFYNDPISLKKVIKEVPILQTGGTLAVHLACHALQRGYESLLYVYNLQLFDPTWFLENSCDISRKLQEQIVQKNGKRITAATSAYLDYLALGGTLAYRDLSVELIREFLDAGTPILTGLSATYLYDCARERDVSRKKSVYDDIRGTPTGHFVVLTAMKDGGNHVHIADPYHDNPLFRKSRYTVKIQKLINAILMGIITYDGNLLIIRPKRHSK